MTTITRWSDQQSHKEHPRWKKALSHIIAGSISQACLLPIRIGFAALQTEDDPSFASIGQVWRVVFTHPISTGCFSSLKQSFVSEIVLNLVQMGLEECLGETDEEGGMSFAISHWIAAPFDVAESRSLHRAAFCCSSRSYPFSQSVGLSELLAGPARIISNRRDLENTVLGVLNGILFGIGSASALNGVATGLSLISPQHSNQFEEMLRRPPESQPFVSCALQTLLSPINTIRNRLYVQSDEMVRYGAAPFNTYRMIHHTATKLGLWRLYRGSPFIAFASLFRSYVTPKIYRWLIDALDEEDVKNWLLLGGFCGAVLVSM